VNPEDLDRTEQGVLGGMIRFPDDTIAEIVADVGLREDHFRVFHHRIVFSAVVALWDAGKPVDVGMVADELNARGKIKDLGGYQFLALLMEQQPTAAGAKYQAQVVRNRGVIRALHGAAQETAAETAPGVGNADQLLEAAQRRFFAVAEAAYGDGPVRLEQVVAEVFDRIDDRARNGGRVGGLPTGFRDLDELLGGLHNSELIVLGARPSVGKTTLAMQIARNAAVDHKAPTLAVSLEMSRVELGERLMCSDARVNGHRLRRGMVSAEDSARLAAVRDPFRAPLFIDHAPAQRLMRIAASARRLKQQDGLRLVVIDYLQLIEPDDERAPRQEQVSRVSRRLKALAKELNIPVLALSQLNRASEDAERPRLSHLRESGSLEQDADVVLLMHRPQDEPGVVEVEVAKQRNGPTGTVKLTFLPAFTRFANYACGIPFEASA
jgi:replicative DNA helicase